MPLPLRRGTTLWCREGELLHLHCVYIVCHRKSLNFEDGWSIGIVFHFQPTIGRNYFHPKYNSFWKFSIFVADNPCHNFIHVTKIY